MVKKSFVLILLLKLMLLCNSVDTLKTNAGQTVANVGIYLSDVDDVDLDEQTFYAEFYLSIDWPKGGKTAENFDFYTSRDIIKSHVTKWKDENHNYYACKISGRFKTQMDLKKFPFDNQILSIKMNDFFWNEDSLRYNIYDKYNGYAKNISILGWEILNHKTSLFTLHDYGDKFSTYEYDVIITRNPYESFYKIFFPLLTILFVAYLGLVIPMKEFSTRISLGITSLLSIIALHFTISSLFAELNYPTKIDTIIFICYLLIALNICLMIFIANFHDSGKDVFAEKLNKYGKIYSPIIYLLIALAFVVMW